MTVLGRLLMLSLLVSTAACGNDTLSLFLDEDHFSLEGHRMVAELLSETIAGKLSQ